MYYVPDGTVKCGYYECTKCGEKFLDIQTNESITCPFCESEIDYEIGPDEDINTLKAEAKLIKIVEGEEVEKLDMLLSLAVTGGNYEWI